MRRDAPAFWSQRPGSSALARLLSPLGALYHGEVQRRLRTARPYRPSIPVICVGNATMGGVGKTPMARWIGAALKAKGAAPHVVTRGYGGSLKGPVHVGPEHTAAEVGDEPLLLARDFPVTVARDRALGARAAEDAGAGVILMDDGLQNPSLAKDLSLLLVDAASLFGNGEVFPAGPLRERPSAAAGRCQAIVAILPGPEARAPHILKRLADRRPLIEAWFALDAAAIPARPLAAFCGIGQPDRFFRSLAAHDADVVAFNPFPDHHPFTEGEVEDLHRQARRLGAELVTTEKDFMRLPPPLRHGITPLPGGLVIRDDRAMMRLLEDLR